MMENKGLKLISINFNIIKLQNIHKDMEIRIYENYVYIYIKDKQHKFNRNYHWYFNGQNLIPKKYQDLVIKYVVMIKLL